MNSQDLVIGDDDTSNDYSNDDRNDLTFNIDDHGPRSKSDDVLHNIADDSSNAEIFELMKSLEAERTNSADIQTSPMSDDIQILPEDEEFHVERMLRLREEERATTNKRLLAPPDEVRKRQIKSKKTDDNLINELRLKQIEMVDLQISVQQTLLENARILQDEAIERLELTKIQRRIAESQMS